MPEIRATVSTAWSDGATLFATASTSWKDGVTIWSSPSAYPLPSFPSGGTSAQPSPTAVTLVLEAADVYHVPHTMTAVDARDGTPLSLVDVVIATDRDSSFWSLAASGPQSLFSRLTSGEQPALVDVTIDGTTWSFVVDSVNRSRAHNENNISVRGRSVTAAAGTPWQPEQNWSISGATTGAQLCALANLYTGVSVVWEVEDWLIPDRVFSLTSSPLGVVKRVAEAIGAIVRSARSGPLLYVSPSYPSLPNAWAVGTPHVRIAFEAIESESFERADRPEYTGLYLSGQQSGAYGFVRLNGTNGGTLHPFITDVLLTDTPALRQRGQSVLGASGQQALRTITLPVVTGAGKPGVLELNQIVQVPDPDGEWVGIVRSVSVRASLPSVMQTVQIEQHTSLISGTAIETDEDGNST